MNGMKIDGFQLEKMLKNGLAKLRQRESEINRLNVFPVSDGDTGTNMRLTLGQSVADSQSNENIGQYASDIGRGMLLGARGNSGVILSQFFKGFAKELSPFKEAGASELCAGFVAGYQSAYKAVVKPAEGTILTVTRLGIEGIKDSLSPEVSVEELLGRYLSEMKKVLAQTPEMLPVLKKAGVVDSGALGYVTIVEGMLGCLTGEDADYDCMEAKPAVKCVNLDLFNEDSAFEDGYCMEFILQLMNGEKYDESFSLNEFIEEIQKHGNSIVAAEDGKRVKVHIHTLSPEKIMALSRRFGEFLTFKIENMQVQHNEHDRELSAFKERKRLAIVAVASGDGMKRIYEELGCDIVIDGGATMNTSSGEFLEAFRRLNADRIVVLPNNPNVILSARQAVKLFSEGDVTVLPSKSMAEGYFAVAMDVQNSEDTDFRIREMLGGLQNTLTLSEATAVRDSVSGAVACKKGDEILLLGGELVGAGSNAVGVIMDGFNKLNDIDEKETCVVFKGSGVSGMEEEELESRLAEEYPDLQTVFVDGGQNVYHWILGII